MPIHAYLTPAGMTHRTKGLQTAREVAAAAAAFGAKIRAERVKAGLTQAELAQKTGIDRSHLSEIERSGHFATEPTMIKLASALGLTVEILLSPVSPPPKPRTSKK